VNFIVKEFPSSPIERVMRKAGADRVSADAVEEMKTIMLEIADKISMDAVIAARHADRVTVKDDDIKFVARLEKR